MSTDDHHLPELGFVTVGLQKLRTGVWRGAGVGRPLLFFNGIGANLEIARRRPSRSKSWCFSWPEARL